MSRRKKVPNILPREPLTQKAKAAIKKYAALRCRDLLIFDFAVDYALKAERMRRVDLYAWLEAKGYRWDSKWKTWKLKKSHVH